MTADRPLEISLTPEDRKHARALAAYDQNSQSFRALNQLMWQIPLLSMTLTGGLWFGVAKTEASTIFQIVLLVLAGVGNLVLFVAMFRLRYVMERHLEWLENFDTSAFVVARAEAPTNRWHNKPFVIRNAFQTMLLLASLSSFALTGAVLWDGKAKPSASARAAAFYDRGAADLVDRYEALAFEDAHPWLVDQLTNARPKIILDVGAGSGRDAAAMAAMGHAVTAAEPSDRMRTLARATHATSNVAWRDTALPALAGEGIVEKRFDLIVLSAVWMHLPPKQRGAAMERLAALLADGGTIYITLRTGPADRDRGIHAVSVEEVEALGHAAGLTAKEISDRPDLLGRTGIRWKTVVLDRAAAPGGSTSTKVAAVQTSALAQE